MIWILDHFGVPLLLTILIECFVAFLLGYRQKLMFGAIVIVNFVTNPTLNYIIVLLEYFQWMAIYWCLVNVLEVVVVFVEWGMLCYMFRYPRKQLFLLSFAMNLSSYLAGLIIYH